ncbi:MAG TPA: HAD hydrolase family protein [Ginsengibacter sp.]|nr:HAD hydrolase family protein [Ginsengibacter sp.]
MNILSRLRQIKTFVFDIDGVLTDGGLLIDDSGQWLRRMNIKDGYALQLAIKYGYNILVISGSESIPVAERLAKLGVTDVFMKVLNKESLLKEYLLKYNCGPGEVLFMGDDIPDYNCMQIADFACCPADAAVEIKQISSYISSFGGGCGCVRDVIEKVLKLNNNWPLQTPVAAT